MTKTGIAAALRNAARRFRRAAPDVGRGGPGRGAGNDPPRGVVSSGLLGHALDAVSEGSLITDALQSIVYANTAFTAVSGYSAEEVLGRNCRLLQGPGSDPATIAAVRSALARGESYRGEILNYRKDHTPFWNALTITPLRDESGVITHFVSVQRDVTARKTLEDRLRHLAFHDPVTDLPNRAALDRRLSNNTPHPGSTGTRTAIGIIDLDDFKSVNIAFGHEAGDLLLSQFGRRVRASLRGPDFLARLGADQFAVVIQDLDPDTTKEQLESILGDLHRCVETDFVLSPGIGVRIRMGMGVALCPPGRTGGTAALRRAEAALHHLKTGNTAHETWWHLDTAGPAAPELHGTPEVPASQAQAYRKRLFTGGLHMHFQPVVDLRSGAILMLEALARLVLDDGTVLPPGAFIPLLNDADTDRLFRVGLDQALARLAAWDSQGLRHRISVNLPPCTLLNPDCVHWVAAALERHNIAPDRLVVELLEHRLQDSDVQLRAFTALRDLGVGMALDDLGAGHSSLRRLTAMPFNTVKIDHRIPAQLRTSPIPTLTFLATMIQLGRDMGWQIIAEGLEDAAITEAATILGIPYGQGYHLGRPMPADSIPIWIAALRPPARRGPVRTFPGALAFQWQYARFNSPHPEPLDRCPMTAFLAAVPSAAPAMNWHRDQHTGTTDHTAPAAQLLHWLTERATHDHHTPP